MAINICHLYPDILNIYGDRGNIIALQQRAKLRGLSTTLTNLGLGEKFTAHIFDFVFIGGGQDFEQSLLQTDLLKNKAACFKAEVEAGLVALAICGGYQLMGRYYLHKETQQIEGLGLLDLHTETGASRIIGNIIAKTDIFASSEQNILLGFENHNGRSYLAAGAKPLAVVCQGQGNNGQDMSEGCRYKNLFGTYMHGSFLPKNPAMTDYLLDLALERKGYNPQDYPQVDTPMEQKARQALLQQLKFTVS